MTNSHLSFLGFGLGWICFHHQPYTSSCFLLASHGALLLQDLCWYVHYTTEYINILIFNTVPVLVSSTSVKGMLRMPAGFSQFSLVLGLVSYLVIKALVVLRNYRVINRPIFLLLVWRSMVFNNIEFELVVFIWKATAINLVHVQALDYALKHYLQIFVFH